MITNHQIDDHLDNVEELMLRWKAGIMRDVGVAIVQAALLQSTIWPDDPALDFSAVPMESRNAIGIAWRLLATAGVIERTMDFRRSHADFSRGRTIFRYVLLNARLARGFIRMANEVLVDEPEFDFAMHL